MTRARRPCSFPGCPNDHVARDLCGAHWKQRYERGQQLKPLRVWEPQGRRLESMFTRTDGCWEWTGRKNAGGYGMICWNKRETPAHRVVYEQEVGPIPAGLVIDHLCRVRHCMNPAHMEIVTIGQNTLRGVGPSAVNARSTHCKRGHPFDEANTIHRSDGGRRCRTCKWMLRVRRANERDRARKNASAPGECSCVDTCREGGSIGRCGLAPRSVLQARVMRLERAQIP